MATAGTPPTRPTSPSGPTPSSASTTCATTWRRSLERTFQRGHPFAIVDEVDNILIDEARTPLIISGSPEKAADLYYTFARMAKTLEGSEAKVKLKALGESKDTSEAEYDYEYDEKHKTVAPTERGVEKAEKFLGVENLYLSEHGTLVNHLIQSLKAESLYKRDKDYAVIDGQVMIIDEFTGRILEGRRWSEGLHQAVEAKEGLAIREENQTLATITLQNYFRLYDKLSGMTGTALTEATEFMKIYEMPVVEIPTNRDMVRDDANDQIYKTRDGKWKAVVDEIAERNENGQPILVGTVSVEVSEMLSGEFKKRGIEHTVLNAKPEHAQREGETVAQAGRVGSVTIATNMAGRGVDIKLGGDPEMMAEGELRKLGVKPDDPNYEEELAELMPRLEERCREEGEKVREARRALHLRHRAPRVAADRQPAARPRRPPGRSRRLSLLPLRAGRPRPALRRRPDLQDPRPPRPRRRRGRGVPARGEDADQADRERAEEGRGAELPQPQARPRVRRRDERAAPRDLPLPARGARGPRHGRHRARAARRRDLPQGRRVHRLRRLRGVGARRPREPAQHRLPGLARAGRARRADLSREQIAEMLTEDALAAYDEREEEFGDELMRALERHILLQIIDVRWKEHLHEMDYLREGIHLRGFAQIDPLVAYKNEGFTMFELLMDSLWEEFARLIFHVDVELQPAEVEEAFAPGDEPSDVRLSGGTEAEQPSALAEARAAAATGGAAVATAAPAGSGNGAPASPTNSATVVKADAEKIGRNDPCWCGSGKKYKKCHGA